MSERYTNDDYERAIALAVSEGDLTAAESLLTMYAVKNPRRAELVVSVMRLGVSLREAE